MFIFLSKGQQKQITRFIFPKLVWDVEINNERQGQFSNVIESLLRLFAVAVLSFYFFSYTFLNKYDKTTPFIIFFFFVKKQKQIFGILLHIYYKNKSI